MTRQVGPHVSVILGRYKRNNVSSATAVSLLPAAWSALENALLIGSHSYAVPGLAVQVAAGTPKQPQHANLNVPHAAAAETLKQAEHGDLNVFHGTGGMLDGGSPVGESSETPKQTVHEVLHVCRDADGWHGMRSLVRKGWYCSDGTDMAGMLD